MTPEERAARLCERLGIPANAATASYIAIDIRAAVEEAYEDLAKKAEELDLDGHYLRAYDIRARAKEVLGGGHDTGD